MQLVLIMIQEQKVRFFSLNRCRTKCIGLHISIQLQNALLNIQIEQKQTDFLIIRLRQ